jgi:nitrogen regulatory protein PII
MNDNDELIILIFDSSIEDEMMEALQKAGMTCYTKVPGVQGVGRHSDPKLDTHVWPGTNTMMLLSAQVDVRERMLKAIREMKELHSDEGVRAFLVPVQDTV